MKIRGKEAQVLAQAAWNLCLAKAAHEKLTGEGRLVALKTERSGVPTSGTGGLQSDARSQDLKRNAILTATGVALGGAAFQGAHLQGATEGYHSVPRVFASDSGFEADSTMNHFGTGELVAASSGLVVLSVSFLLAKAGGYYQRLVADHLDRDSGLRIRALDETRCDVDIADFAWEEVEIAVLAYEGAREALLAADKKNGVSKRAEELHRSGEPISTQAARLVSSMSNDMREVIETARATEVFHMNLPAEGHEVPAQSL